MKMTKLYLYVTHDEYELPLVVTDSMRELADWLGVKKTTVESSLSKVRHGVVKDSRYKEVWVEDD